jgi:hypothetical protein
VDSKEVEVPSVNMMMTFFVGVILFSFGLKEQRSKEMNSNVIVKRFMMQNY